MVIITIIINMIRDYKDLRVWQQGISLVKMIYSVMLLMPKEELYSLTDQIKRAAVSVPSNIAEGQARGAKEFRHFLRIAQGSLSELETQLILTTELQMLNQTEISPILDCITSLKKQINSLINSLTKTIH